MARQTKKPARTTPTVVKGDIVLFTCEGDANDGKNHRVAAVYIDPDDQAEMARIVPLDDGLEEIDTPIEGYLRVMERAGTETPGHCKKCGTEMRRYPDPSRPKGFHDQCPACNAERLRQRRQDDPEENREKNRRWREENPNAYAAHQTVKNAVRTGELKAAPCERCGRDDQIHAHHDDYSKPLDVRWLCPDHHRERHRELDAIETDPDRGVSPDGLVSPYDTVSSLNSPASDKGAGVSTEERVTGKRGRGRPARSDNAVLAQSDEALVSQLREVLTLKADLDEKTAAQRSANSLYRSAIKVATKIGAGIGVTAADVVWLVTSTARDPNEIDAETRRRNKIAELMKLPLGTQLGLLEGQPTVGGVQVSVATRIEDRKIATGQTGAETTDQQIELSGYKAYQLGMTSAEVPAFDAPDDRRKDLWMAGWDRAKEEVAQKAAKALSRPHPTPGAKTQRPAHSPAAVADALAPKTPASTDDDVKVF